MKHIIVAVCLTILAAPAWAWEAPQSGGVAIQPYHATLNPAILNGQQRDGQHPGQAGFCFTEHCHTPAPGTCYTEHCHGTPPATAQAPTQAPSMAGRFAMQR